MLRARSVLAQGAEDRVFTFHRFSTLSAAQQELTLMDWAEMGRKKGGQEKRKKTEG
jgi:hypothetical protein